MFLISTMTMIIILFISISNAESRYVQIGNWSYQLQDSTSYNDIEIQGIIVDSTQTKIGKDFYDLFYQKLGLVEKLPGLTNQRKEDIQGTHYIQLVN